MTSQEHGFDPRVGSLLEKYQKSGLTAYGKGRAHSQQALLVKIDRLYVKSLEFTPGKELTTINSL